MLTEEQLINAPEDDYMNEEQLAYFRQLLQDESQNIRDHLVEARESLSQQQYEADELDKAAQ